jgi:hypothetical protein
VTRGSPVLPERGGAAGIGKGEAEVKGAGAAAAAAAAMAMAVWTRRLWACF